MTDVTQPAPTPASPPQMGTPPVAPQPAPVVQPPPAGARRRSWVDILLVVGAVVALAGIGFAVGRLTAPTTTGFGQGRGQFNGQFGGNPGNGPLGGNAGNGQFGGNAGSGQFGGGRAFFGGGSLALTGKVTELAADHLTLEVANGSTVTIPVDSSTAYYQQTGSTSSDVHPGDAVIVEVTRDGAPAASPGAGGGPGGPQLGAASSITVTAP